MSFSKQWCVPHTDTRPLDVCGLPLQVMYAVSQDTRTKTEVISFHSLVTDSLLAPKFKVPMTVAAPGPEASRAGAKPTPARLSKVGEEGDLGCIFAEA